MSILEKNTFGKTPAALYLTDMLNQRNNDALNKKVSRFLSGKRCLLSELINANNLNVLSAKNLSGLLLKVRGDVAFDSNDELINNLVNNIVIGEIKDALRKSQVIRKIEAHQNRYQNRPVNGLIKNKDGYEIIKGDGENKEALKYSLEKIKATVTIDDLNQKWQTRMKKKNITINVWQFI